MSCENPYVNRQGYYKIKFVDGTSTTPKTIELKAITAFPDLPTPRRKLNFDTYLVQGVESGFLRTDDTVEGKDDMTVTFDIVESQVSNKASELWHYLQKKVDPSDGTTALVSTNDGSTTILDADGADRTSCIPNDIFTFEMRVLYIPESGTSEKEFGFKYERVEASAVLNMAEKGQVTLTLTPHDRPITINQTDYNA